MSNISISIQGLEKTYRSGLHALKGVDLEIERGEIFALLGPNGAGKTTLIGIVCGLVNPSSGSVRVDGFDIQRDYKQARAKIGLVPQEIASDAFESVMSTMRFSRGLFGKPRDDAYLEKVLKDLSLWDKRDTSILELSGGMKRRVAIGKALSHEPEILFLDEPTAGVDVELRRGMWNMVRDLKRRGVTIVLTTHYTEEAEEMADRVGIILHGEIILVEEKVKLMKTLGKRRLRIALAKPLEAIPSDLERFGVELEDEQRTLVLNFDRRDQSAEIAQLLRAIDAAAIPYVDLETEETSLEDIFVDLVSRKRT